MEHESVFFERKGKIINGYIIDEYKGGDTFIIRDSKQKNYLVKYNEIYKTEKEILDKKPVKVDTKFISLLKDGKPLSFRQVHELSKKMNIPKKLLIWSPAKKLEKGAFLTQQEFNKYVKQSGYSGERAKQHNIKFSQIKNGKSPTKDMKYKENWKDKVMKNMYPVNDTRLLKEIGLLSQEDEGEEEEEDEDEEEEDKEPVFIQGLKNIGGQVKVIEKAKKEIQTKTELLVVGCCNKAGSEDRTDKGVIVTKHQFEETLRKSKFDGNT